MKMFSLLHDLGRRQHKYVTGNCVLIALVFFVLLTKETTNSFVVALDVLICSLVVGSCCHRFSSYYDAYGNEEFFSWLKL